MPGAYAAGGLLLLSLLFCVEAQAQRRNAEGFLEPYSFSGRFGLGAGQTRTLTTDTEGRTTETIGVSASLLAGAGFALHERLAADLDVGAIFDITPEVGLDQLTLTPGLRAFVLPQLYGRVAALNFLLVPRNTLALVGAGYYITTERLALFLELNVVAWSWKETDTLFIPRFGLEAAF